MYQLYILPTVTRLQSYLKSLGYTGEFITWREMLCEGKTSIDVGSETFWKTRFEFLKSSYKVTKKNIY